MEPGNSSNIFLQKLHEQRYFLLPKERDIIKPSKTMLSVTCFCNLVKKYAEQRYEEFIKLFFSQLKQHLLKNPEYSCSVPIILDKDEKYLSLKINAFVLSYAKQAKKLKLSGWMGQAEMKVRDNVQKDEKIDVCQIGEDEINRLTLQATNDEKKYIVPNFITDKIMAYDTLVSYSLTEEFVDLLNTAKNLVKSQIQTEQNNVLLEVYVKFIREFVRVSVLNNGECEEQVDENILSKAASFNISDYFSNWKLDLNKYNSHNSTQGTIIEKEDKFGNFLVDCWKIVADKFEDVAQKKISQLNQQYESDGGLKGKIIEIVKRSLQTVHLVSCSTPEIYADACEDSIIISIGNKGVLTFKEYKQGPLLPYICLCIYHELTHLILHEIKKLNINTYDRSFSYNSNTIGSFILRVAKEYQQQSCFQVLIPSQIQKQCNLELFQKTKIKVSDFLVKLEQNRFILKDSLTDLKEKFNIFSQILEFELWGYRIYSPKQIFEYMKDLLREQTILQQKHQQSIQQEIDMDEKMFNLWLYTKQKKQKQRLVGQNSQVKIISQQNQKMLNQWLIQRKYKFFFSLFLTEEIAKIWITEDSLQQYQQIKNSLQRSSIRRYFIKKNDVIEQFIKIFTIENFSESQRYLSKVVDEYIKYTLKDKLTWTDFINEMETYCSDISEQHLKEFIKISHNIFSQYLFSTLYSKFELTDFIKNKKKSGLIFFSKVGRSWLFQNNSDLGEKMTKVFEIECYKQMFIQFLKYSEIHQILFRLPSFFTSTAESRYQSAYDTQRKLFNNLKDKIYAKDYHHIKSLNSSISRSRLVGVEPKEKSERRLCMRIGRVGKQSPYIDISQRICWTHYIGELTVQNRLRKEKIKELKAKIQEKRNLAEKQAESRVND